MEKMRRRVNRFKKKYLAAPNKFTQTHKGGSKIFTSIFKKNPDENQEKYLNSPQWKRFTHTLKSRPETHLFSAKVQ